MAPSADFLTAKDKVEKLKTKPNQDELLKLYSLYKQATQDPPIDQAPKPGFMDFTGKTKRSAWQKIVDEGVTPEQAEQQYIETVAELETKYGLA